MPPPPVALALLAALLAALTNASASTCVGNQPITKGKCFTGYSGICATYVGSSVYLPVPGPDNPYKGPAGLGLTSDSATIAAIEANVITTISLVRKNRVILGDTCTFSTDWYVCIDNFYPCVPADPSVPSGEGIPILPCQSACQDWWAACTQFNLYYTTSISQGLTPQQLDGVNCYNGTYTLKGAAQPPDVLGGRWVPSMAYAYPLGYNGTEHFPTGPRNYVMENGSSVLMNCYAPNETLAATIQASHVACAEPLIATYDINGQVVGCFIPCPVPVFSDTERNSAQLAYVIPAFFGLISCAFVLLDSVWVIFETSGGFGGFRSRYLGSSSNSGGGSNLELSVSNAHVRQLRRTTLYSLTGALLGIAYFVIGIVPTLWYRSAVSCGEATSIDFNQVLAGTVDTSTLGCRTQRVAPFIIQLMFNLILYSIVRIAAVVSDRLKNMQPRSKTTLEVVLVLYCAGVPIVCLIVSSVIDKLSTDILTSLNQLVRQAILCQPRYVDESTEFVLIYLPFIITGVLISALSLYIFVSLRTIQDKVAGVGMKNKTASDVALRLLVIRLALLGLCTFVVLIVLMITTSIFVQSIQSFTSLWNQGFLCADTGYPCQVAQCNKYAEEAKSVQPSASLIGVQLAMLSCIPALFGVFFAGQSLARLYKEYMDGSLALKISNALHGRHTMAGSSHGGTGPGSQMPTSGGGGAVAAYQLADGSLAKMDLTRGSDL